MKTEPNAQQPGIIGATKSRIPWVPLVLLAAAASVYLWRTDVQPRWPFMVGIAVLTAQVLIRSPHSHRVGSVVVVHHAATKGDIALMWGVFISMVVLPLLRLMTPLVDRFDYFLPTPLAVFGVAISLLGVWFFYRSHAELGKQWSATLQIGDDHKLVTTGIYAKIRHPMYTALWLIALGQPLLFQNWVAGPPIVLFWAMLYWTRLPKEEAMMVETFGADYQEYRKRVGALWPRLLSPR